MLATLLTVIVALIHFYFLYLEMFAWEAPRTRKVFGMTADLAVQTRVMAANQGLYNGFIALGLLIGLITGNPSMVVYLLCCVVVAGVYALYCGIRSALYVQSVPALLALVLTWLTL
mgnify:FL=1